MELDHVGVLVRDPQPWVDRFTRILGISTAEVERVTATDAESGDTIDLTFLSAGAQRIELICPRHECASRFSRKLDSDGEGIFHISFRVPDLEETVERLADGADTIPVVIARLWAGIRKDPIRDEEPTDREVKLAWIPEELSGGINLEIIEAANAPGSDLLVPPVAQSAPGIEDLAE